MKKITIITLVSAAVWIVVRIAVGQIATPSNANLVGVMTNLFFILLLIFGAMFIKYRFPPKPSAAFLSDLKDAMRPAMIYILIVVAYMCLHYGVFSDEMDVRRNAVIENIRSQTDSDQELQAYREMMHQPKMTQQEILNAEIEKANLFISMKIFIPMSLMVLVLVSFVYALLGVLIWRRFLRPIQNL